jgi:hypothetical protein
MSSTSGGPGVGSTDATGPAAPDESATIPLPRTPIPRWFTVLAVLAAGGLVPWIVILAFALPSNNRTAHYAVAWVGFDVAMFFVLALMALAALRRSTWTEPLAACAATLLVVDAWFDIVTAATRHEVIEAVLSAVIFELPLAVVCAWVAVNFERLRQRVFRRLLRRAGAEREHDEPISAWLRRLLRED